MGKLKSRNKFIFMGSVLIIAIGVILLMNSDKYIYEDELEQILGISKVDVKNKELADSWAIGEWYVCEVYEVKDKPLFKELHNKLYAYDSSWTRVDWQKLPVNELYDNILSMVINYRANYKIDHQTEKMKNVISSGSGYYSILYKTLLDGPERVIFSLFDKVENRLYVVDLKF